MTTVKQHTKCIHGIPLDEWCGTCVYETGRTDERLLPRMPVKQAIEAYHARLVEQVGETVALPRKTEQEREQERTRLAVLAMQSEPDKEEDNE